MSRKRKTKEDVSRTSDIADGNGHSVHRLDSFGEADKDRFTLFRTASISSTTEETRLHDHFEEIIGDCVADNAALLAKPFTFKYKNRVCTGSALHIAALHPDGAEVMNELLAMRSDPAGECTFNSFNKEGRAQAVHIAAGCGNLGVLWALVRSTPELLEAKAKFDGRDHYSPIHDAIWFEEHDAVEFLLGNGAHVDSVNREGKTALHLAAARGDVKGARLLLRYGARRQQLDQERCSPLVRAIEAGAFPYRHLHILSWNCINNILEAGEHCPGAAAELAEAWARKAWEEAGMEDDEDENAHTELLPTGQSAASHSSALNLEQWLRIMMLSPRAGAVLLDAATVQPVVRTQHHSLPKRAYLQGQMRCEYRPEATWEYCVETEARVPKWHNELAPQRQPRWLGVGQMPERQQVTVKILKVPGILNARVLHMVTQTDDGQLFNSLGVRAMLQFLWMHTKRAYYANICYKSIVLIALFMCLRTRQSDAWSRHSTWSVLCAASLRDVFVEAFQAYGYHSQLIGLATYFSVDNILDLAFVSLPVCLCWRTAGTCMLSEVPWLLAFVSFASWWKAMYTLRGFPLVGKRVLPILCSFIPLAGMVTIALFIMFGFAHAFLALRLYFGAEDEDGAFPLETWEDVMNVVMGTFRILMSGAGEFELTTETVQGPTTSPFLYFWFFSAVSAFSICVLNLTIAVHGEAYDAAQERSMATFLQERARICFVSMLQPEFQWFYIRYPTAVVLVLVFVAIAISVPLLHVAELHPVFPSAIMLLTMLFIDAILLQRPWRADPVTASDRFNFLWICHSQKADQEEDDPENLSRLKNLKTFVRREFKGIDRRVSRMEEDLSNRLCRIEELIQDAATCGADEAPAPRFKDSKADFMVPPMRSRQVDRISASLSLGPRFSAGSTSLGRVRRYSIIDPDGRGPCKKLSKPEAQIPESAHEESSTDLSVIKCALHVDIISARGLRSADWLNFNPKSDPYCTCEIHGKPETQIQTPVIDCTVNPVWNHQARIHDYTPGENLEFKVWDKDSMKADDFLGGAVLESARFNEAGFEGELWLDDSGDAEESYLKVHVAVIWPDNTPLAAGRSMSFNIKDPTCVTPAPETPHMPFTPFTSSRLVRRFKMSP